MVLALSPPRTGSTASAVEAPDSARTGFPGLQRILLPGWGPPTVFCNGTSPCWTQVRERSLSSLGSPLLWCTCSKVAMKSEQGQGTPASGAHLMYLAPLRGSGLVLSITTHFLCFRAVSHMVTEHCHEPSVSLFMGM